MGVFSSTRKPDVDSLVKDFQNIFFCGIKWDVLQKQRSGIFRWWKDIRPQVRAGDTNLKTSFVTKQFAELPFFSFAESFTVMFASLLTIAFSIFIGLSRTSCPFKVSALVRSISEAKSTCAYFLWQPTEPTVQPAVQSHAWERPCQQWSWSPRSQIPL